MRYESRNNNNNNKPSTGCQVNRNGASRDTPLIHAAVKFLKRVAAFAVFTHARVRERKTAEIILEKNGETWNPGTARGLSVRTDVI